MQLAPLYPILYRFLKPLFPDCLWSGSSTSRKIALTFDDGPHPAYTLPLLEVLERHQVKGSFFWLGNCVQRNPEIAKTVYEQGHYLGLHGYDHQSFPVLSPQQLRESLRKTQKAIAAACDIDGEQVRDVRPPNGLFTPPILRQLSQERYRVVMWSVVPEDWQHPGVEVVLQRTLEQVNNGAVIVLHDGYYGGKDVTKITAQLIPQLVQSGYQLVTIEELWQQHKEKNLN
jgi:peptidoglycan/xylan/chitin deacetylase (PgdA/CDA1 family)